jgi:hypothetical protein
MPRRLVMKIVVIEESAAEGGRLALLVPERDLPALQALAARAGQKVLAIKEESDAS